MWNKGPQLPKNMRIRYNTPTTLAGRDLYYIGGMTDEDYNQTGMHALDTMIPMTEILIYHIDNSMWELKNATGDIPQQRISHTIAASRFYIYTQRCMSKKKPSIV